MKGFHRAKTKQGYSEYAMCLIATITRLLRGSIRITLNYISTNAYFSLLLCRDVYADRRMRSFAYIIRMCEFFFRLPFNARVLHSLYHVGARDQAFAKRLI